MAICHCPSIPSCVQDRCDREGGPSLCFGSALYASLHAMRLVRRPIFCEGAALPYVGAGWTLTSFRAIRLTHGRHMMRLVRRPIFCEGGSPPNLERNLILAECPPAFSVFHSPHSPILPFTRFSSFCRFWLPFLLPLMAAASGCRLAAQNPPVLRYWPETKLCQAGFRSLRKHPFSKRRELGPHTSIVAMGQTVAPASGAGPALRGIRGT